MTFEEWMSKNMSVAHDKPRMIWDAAIAAERERCVEAVRKELQYEACDCMDDAIAAIRGAGETESLRCDDPRLRPTGVIRDERPKCETCKGQGRVSRFGDTWREASRPCPDCGGKDGG